jgi:hypothetical protein
MVPLQVIANLNSPGLEELIGMRKKLYIDRWLSITLTFALLNQVLYLRQCYATNVLFVGLQF